ncbi:hypothetical protein BDR26DRAFT_879605 [Obelidium mucronatum]|nr:hypothetical protein BDR26DRAFT_879605 [Obelidium mucronatum]
MNSHATLTASIWLKLRERISFLENRLKDEEDAELLLFNTHTTLPPPPPAAASSPYRASDSSQTSIIVVKKELAQDATHPGPRQDCDHLHTTKRSFQKTRHAARRDSDKLKESDDNPYRMKLSHRYRKPRRRRHCFTPPSPTNNNKKQNASVANLPCFMFQNNTCSKNKACLFQHLCLICRSNHQEDNNDASSSVSSRNGEARHPLVDCPGNYCLFFQREAGWCRAKDCIHVHKCLKCDSEGHGSMQCDYGSIPKGVVA